jgi:hypothetical protein
LSLNFDETIGRLFPWDLERHDGKFGRQFRRVIRSETEYGEIEGWIAANSEIVFIRSLLGTCVAASELQSTPGQHTEIGELERRAKYGADASARASLLERMVDVFHRLLEPLQIDAICAVPPSVAGEFSLPGWLASGLSEQLEIENLTPMIRWTGVKPKLKAVDVDHKWASLDDAGLTIDGRLEGRRILIVDDLYQSGATVHFVASRLQSAGAAEVHCFAVVKSMRDTDNT